jgi:ComF family protein
MIRLSRFFAEELVPLLKERYPGLPVVPVPSRKEAMKKRGFDPLDRICKELHAHWGIRILPLLSRKWGTKEQKTLNKQERIVNLKTAFYFIPSMKKNEHQRIPGSVVLLDDVFTTGTTLNACAEILQQEGTQDVYGVTIARD